MSEPEKPRGCGCSLISCLGGCVGGFVLLGIAGVVAFYVFPDIAARGAKVFLEKHTAKPLAMPPLTRQPTAYASLRQKVDAFSADVSAKGTRDVSLVMTEGEINAWIAEQIKGENVLPVRLYNARVQLLAGAVRLQAVVQGSEVAGKLPPGTTEWVRRVMTQMKYVNATLKLSLEAKDGKIHYRIRQASLGEMAVPVASASSIAAFFNPERTVELRAPGFKLTDVRITKEALTVKGVAGTAP